MEPKRVVGGYDEAVMEVEAACGVVDGVYHDEPGSSGLAGSDGLSQRLSHGSVSLAGGLAGGAKRGTDQLPRVAVCAGIVDGGLDGALGLRSPRGVSKGDNRRRIALVFSSSIPGS